VALSIAALEERLSDIAVPVLTSRNGDAGPPARASAREILRAYAEVIPPNVRTKLGAKQATGDRSRVLWRLTNALLDAGLTPGEVVVLVEKTPWNKFEEDRGRLWTDVNKAHASKGER
jgi:hypothetical protein